MSHRVSWAADLSPNHCVCLSVSLSPSPSLFPLPPSLSAPSRWVCSVLPPLLSPGGSTKCSLCSQHPTLHRSCPAFPVGMTHLTSTHYHKGLWDPGINPERVSIPFNQVPSFPCPKAQLHPVPGNVKIPKALSWRLRKGGRGPGRPHLPAPAEPAQPQTPSISCLWPCPPAINRGSDSIFFKNKHQTLSPQAQKKHSWLGQSPPCPAPVSGHWAPGVQRGTGKKTGSEASLGRAGQAPKCTPCRQSTREGSCPSRPVGPLPPVFPSPLTRLPVLSPRLTVLMERGDSDTAPQATAACLCFPQCRGALGCGEGWGGHLS